MSLGTLFTVVSTIAKYASKIKVNNKVNVNTNSIIEFSAVTRFEPRTLVDSTLDNSEELVQVLQSVNTLFAAYLLQAIAINDTVGNIEIIKHLDKFNPNRQDIKTTYDFKPVIGLESYDSKPANLNPDLYRFGLPSMESISADRAQATYRDGVDIYKKVAGVNDPEATTVPALDKNGNPLYEVKEVPVLDANGNPVLDKKGNPVTKQEKGDMIMRPGNAPGTGVNGSAIKEVLTNDFDLSVGKLFSVEIRSNDQSAQVPVSVRLMVQRASPAAMVDILKFGSNVETIEDRVDRWKMGELEFWRDIVFCQDLIDEHKKALTRDKTGHLQDLMKRAETNRRASRKTGTPSVGTASSIYVISKDTAKAAERALLGKLDNPKTRQKMFENTYSMILVVMDTQWRRATIYHRGIPTPTELTFNELKAASRKGSGTDVMEILRAFKQSEAPRF